MPPSCGRNGSSTWRRNFAADLLQMQLRQNPGSTVCCRYRRLASETRSLTYDMRGAISSAGSPRKLDLERARHGEEAAADSLLVHRRDDSPDAVYPEPLSAEHQTDADPV